MNNNYIIAEIDIIEENINKKIRIINSFEQWKREESIIQEDDYKYENEEEIKDNCIIKINNEKIPFSYFYKFNKKGKYQIQYFFKNNIIKVNSMFLNCSSLTNIDLSNFNNKYVINMSYMFSGCISLININLNNINTENVANMSYMFFGCKSLINIDLSSFNTQNVINMSYSKMHLNHQRELIIS